MSTGWSKHSHCDGDECGLGCQSLSEYLGIEEKGQEDCEGWKLVREDVEEGAEGESPTLPSDDYMSISTGLATTDTSSKLRRCSIRPRIYPSQALSYNLVSHIVLYLVRLTCLDNLVSQQELFDRPNPSIGGSRPHLIAICGLSVFLNVMTLTVDVLRNIDGTRCR